MDTRRVFWGGTAILATVLLAAACGGGHESEGEDDHDRGEVSGPSASATPGTTATPAPTPAAGGGTTISVAYDPDIKPILDSSCRSCHGQLGSYAGTLAVVRPGDASSLLVTKTQPKGSMYSKLPGDRAANAELIRRWVVDNGAAQSR